MTTLAPPTTRRSVRWSPRALTLAVGTLAVVVSQLVVGGDHPFPGSWYLHLADPIDDAERWVVEHRGEHWLFTWLLDPLADTFEWLLEHIESGLTWLPWFALPLIVFVLVARNGRWVSAVLMAATITYPAAVGLWEPTVQTIALMVVAVAVSIVIGFALGVTAARSATLDRVLRPVLDAMQVVPATVYLIPFILFFGIGPVPATLSTAIYAIPPMARLTKLGIQEVPEATVESGRMFGSTPRQLLAKVQLPQALPQLVVGINQSVNAALSIAVLAALIGAGGLGQVVLDAIKIRRPGRAFVAGMAIVAIAIVFDRVARSFVERSRRRQTPGAGPRADRRVVLGVLGAIVVAILVGRALGWIEIPFEWDAKVADPIDDAILWIRDHWGSQLQSFNDFVVTNVWARALELLRDTLAWPTLVGATALVGFWLRGWRLALFGGIAVAVTGLVGQWANALDTLVQSSIALVATALVAIPLGVYAGVHPRLLKAFEPVADTLQTLPALVYAIPFVMVFRLSVVPGILASLLYALPVGVKLTALGVREVPEAPLEAARSFGASARQVLWRVRVPLAAPAIALAVNQMIMMVLANIIIAGLIGAGALGFEAINALTKEGTGLGVEVGLAIVMMALVLDRYTHAVADRLRPPAAR